MLTPTKTPISESDAARFFLKEVRANNQTFYGTDRGQGTLKDFQQTFPHPWLYVGELLQNAVDAGAKHIRLAVDETTRSLVIEPRGMLEHSARARGRLRGQQKMGERRDQPTIS
jgi:hypothetical protein